MRRLTLTMCAAAAGLVALTACGSQTGGSAQPQQQQQQVRTVADLAKLMSAKTSTAHTAHVTMQISTGVGNFSGNGQLDLAGTASKVQLSMTMPQIGPMSMDLIGSTMYLSMPGLLKGSGNKPWIKFDPNGKDPVSQQLSGIVTQEQQNLDPTQAISQLASIGTITKVGSDTVDGQPTTRYAIQVDTQKLLQSNAIPAQSKQLLQSSGIKLPQFFTYTMWLNSDNLPVKFVVDEPIAGQKVDVTVNYTDWGKPVNIQAPPADQVGTLPGS